jgi:hypothetical protein
LVAALLWATTAVAQPDPTPTPTPDTPPAVSEDRKAEARAHFELGLSHFDREEWSAALVEFLKSRELLPTRTNTKNAAICMRKLGRFDESLDLFEALLRDFPDVSPTERALAQREIADLQASVGTVTIEGAPEGASVSIDAVDRGKTPLKGPLRVAAGSHTLRITVEGALPFEARLDIVGRQATVVQAKLLQLTQSGRLHITEHDGKTLDVVVDGAVVGKTPWNGALAPGKHAVLLRGDEGLGTEPTLVSVEIDKLASLDLVAETLRGALRVEPKPSSALVTIDGIPVGTGPWEGRLRHGPHRLLVTLDGYLAFSRDVSLSPDAREVIPAPLERDPALLIAPVERARIALEIDAALPLGLVVGGDLRDGCTGSCSASLPVGVHGTLHATYSFRSGFGVGINAGYLFLTRTLSGRAETITPVSRPLNAGTVEDSLRLGGLTAGGEAQYKTGEMLPITLRLGLGILIGTMTDSRTGTFTDSTSASYALSTKGSAGATYLYVAPEARIGKRFGEHFEVNAGVELLVMTGLSIPKWDSTKLVKAGADGFGTMPSNTMMGGIVIVPAPGLGAKYEF